MQSKNPTLLLRRIPISNDTKDKVAGTEKRVEPAKSEEKPRELTERELNAVSGGNGWDVKGNTKA